MTANKPEVVAWLHSVRQESDVITDKVRHVWGTPLGSMGQYTVPLIRLSDYEELAGRLKEALVRCRYQASCQIGGEDALRAQLNKIRGVVNEALGNQGDQP